MEAILSYAVWTLLGFVVFVVGLLVLLFLFVLVWGVFVGVPQYTAVEEALPLNEWVQLEVLRQQLGTKKWVSTTIEWSFYREHELEVRLENGCIVSMPRREWATLSDQEKTYHRQALLCIREMCGEVRRYKTGGRRKRLRGKTKSVWETDPLPQTA